MKRTISVAILCAALIFAQPTAFTPTVAAPEHRLQAENLSAFKSQLAAYVRSGQYNREIAEVAKAAHDWVETRTARALPNEKLAAVFDIDETALSNLPDMADCDFCSVAAQGKLYPPDRNPAIPPVRDLYEFAKSKGVAVFFLTGRYESARVDTVNNLRSAGYSAWDDLLMRLNGNTDPAHIMKPGVRAGIERKGYRIILSIGDQLSDLNGGYAERTYKLPNPFYFVD
jgi:predicted secreted acid phosphatase